MELVANKPGLKIEFLTPHENLRGSSCLRLNALARSPLRRPTRVPLNGTVAPLASATSRGLITRVAVGLPTVLRGATLASGRRSAASWFRCARVRDDCDRFYELLQVIGKSAALVAFPIIQVFVRRFNSGDGACWTLAVADSPIRRPNASDGVLRRLTSIAVRLRAPATVLAYGHNWVCPAMLLNHPLFGVIALPS